MATQVVNPNTQMGASGASHAPGIAPDPGATAGTAKFLREDATWNAPVIPANVSSLNGLTGALSLTSTGSTVTITPSGSTIDLEVTGGGGTFNPSGFATFPSGLILQWGHAPSTGGGSLGVTFPMAFPTACLNVTATDDFGTGSVIVSVSALTATNFTLYSNGTNNGNYWFAIGY